MQVLALAILVGALVVGDRLLKSSRVTASTASNITSFFGFDVEEALYSLYLAYRGSGRRTQVA